MKVKLNYFYYIVVYATIIILFIGDGVNKYLNVYGNGESVSVYIRLIIEILFIILSILILNKKKIELYVGIILLFVFFLIGQLSLVFSSAESINDLLVNIKIYNKYIFILLFYHIVDYIYNTNQKLFYKAINLFYFLFIFNIIVCLIGFIVSNELVRAYPFSLRFGYSGFIPKQNEATLFYMLGLTIAYYRFYIQNKKDPLLLFLSFIGAVLLGTKGIYIFILFLLIYHVSLNKKLFKKLLLSVSFFALIIIFYIPQTYMFNYYLGRYKKSGMLSMLLSGRNQIFLDQINIIFDNWNVLNVFFGGQNQNSRAMEMDFFDIFFFFGILGTILYLFLYFKYVFNGFTKNRFKIFFLFSYCFLAFFGGHFFSSAVNGLYLIIVSMLINKTKSL